MGGEAMPQGVDGDVLAQAGVLCGPDADPVHGLAGDGLARDVPGEEPVGRPNDLPVFAEQGEQPWREHDVAVPAALGLSDADDHAFAVDVIDPQAGDLGEPQPGGVGGHEDGAVLDADDGGEEACRLRRG